ncbi:MAG: hypothetical protein BWY82_01699 [Verrucomicrobia bacterium ADurb.Bin474]|nr:MAG: hypothetical protein BWY82_01699 [Verrucomicrobia bacterium ADurb.Bin474]
MHGQHFGPELFPPRLQTSTGRLVSPNTSNRSLHDRKTVGHQEGLTHEFLIRAELEKDIPEGVLVLPQVFDVCLRWTSTPWAQSIGTRHMAKHEAAILHGFHEMTIEIVAPREVVRMDSRTQYFAALRSFPSE